MSNLRGLNVEVTIREDTAILDVLRCTTKEFYKVCNILYKKYGIKHSPEKKIEDKDLEWTKKY